jgi:hypothetical protein
MSDLRRSALSRRRETVADRALWRGRNTVQTPLPPCSPGQVCGYICPPEAVCPSGKRVLGWEFTKGPKPRTQAVFNRAM